MKKIVKLAFAALLMVVSGISMASLVSDSAGGSAYSNAYGGAVHVDGGVTANSAVFTGYGPNVTLAASQGLAGYAGSGYGGASGYAGVQTDAIGVAGPTGAASQAQSQESAYVNVLLGGGVAITGSNSFSASFTPNSQAHSTANHADVGVDFGWWVNAVSGGGTSAGTGANN